MSISLLTAVPGGGKTSYAVWNVIKEAHEQGKIIYTVGIPKLTIPTIELSYDQVRQWFKTSPNEEGLPELLNIEHGSIIVIDEVQRIWPATGAKISDVILEKRLLHREKWRRLLGVLDHFLPRTRRWRRFPWCLSSTHNKGNWAPRSFSCRRWPLPEIHFRGPRFGIREVFRLHEQGPG